MNADWFEVVVRLCWLIALGGVLSVTIACYVVLCLAFGCWWLFCFFGGLCCCFGVVGAGLRLVLVCRLLVLWYFCLVSFLVLILVAGWCLLGFLFVIVACDFGLCLAYLLWFCGIVDCAYCWWGCFGAK